jgi:hypothetical protein
MHRIMRAPIFWAIPCNSAQPAIEGTILACEANLIQ